MSNTTPFLTLIPLGGYGEIGQNCTLWKTAQSAVVVDCGLMFPDDYHLGVDVLIPRFDSILEQRDKLKGIVLTHGHEDHIGALPWLVSQLRTSIYGSAFTLALVERKLQERGLLDRVELVPVAPYSKVVLGDLSFQFFPVCHSIIEGYALGVETPIGRIFHTGDFKIDPAPLDGYTTDISKITEFAGSDGVRLLMSDSTNVERDGHSMTEREVVAAFESLFAQAKGRIIVTLFSSHIQRIQEVFDCAHKFGRQVLVNGLSLVNNIELAHSNGYLRLSTPVHKEQSSMPSLPDDQVVLLVTGSQGEPMSALSRIVGGGHKFFRIQEGDTVLMSSRLIPGNASALTKLINNLYRLGAEVYQDKVHAIHASGHAHREELITILQATKPEYFIPVHGEYRHLVKHCRLAVEQGVPQEKAILLEDGQVLTLLPNAVRRGTPVPAESILVDGKGVGDVGQAVLRERHVLGDEGMVVVVLVLDEATGSILQGPELLSKGFVFEQHFSHVLEDAQCVVLDVMESSAVNDSLERIQERIRSNLRRFFRTILDRDPIVVPVVIKV